MKKFVVKKKEGNELTEELKSKLASLSNRVLQIDELK